MYVLHQGHYVWFWAEFTALRRHTPGAEFPARSDQSSRILAYRFRSSYMAVQNSSSPQHKTDAIRVRVADKTLMGNQLLAAALKSNRHFWVVGIAETSEQVSAALRSPLDVVGR